MAVKIIFEDGDNTPNSILLKNTLAKDNIFFSNGVSQLLNKAMQVRFNGDIIYMFYDVSPNNRYTVKGYSQLVDILRSDPQTYKDMHVIPIICIEYYICQMFNKYNYFYTKNPDALEMINKLVMTFDWKNISSKIKTQKYLSESLEHVYKNIIALQNLKCLHNEFEYDANTKKRKINSIWGIFYEKDCTCERKYCGLKCEDSIATKAERLYTLLPLFIVATEEHKQLLNNMGISIKNILNTEIKKERKEFYNNISRNMGLKSFAIYI